MSENNSIGKKISQFLETDTLTSDTLFTVVEDATNFKITYGDLLPLLGATGTLDQLGGNTGAAVLYVDGTTNYIRNIEPGAGIDVTLSIDDGIEISHNFTINASGEPLIQDASDPSPTVVSLVAGDNVSITTVGPTIEIAATPPAIDYYGQVTLQGNATETVIGTVDVPELIAGTFVVGIESNFIGTTGGRLTYIGDATRIFMVTLNVCINTASGTKQCAVLIGKNGTAIAESQQDAKIDNNSERQISTSFLVSLAQNDYIEGYLMNATDSTNLVAHNAVITVHG